MGYICPSCGEGLPEDTPCPCEMGYDDLDDYDDPDDPYLLPLPAHRTESCLIP